MIKAEITPEQKEYNKKKVRLSIVSMIMNLLLLILFAFSGLSHSFAEFSTVSGNSYVNFILFVLLAGAVLMALGFPLDYYSSFILEQRYGLSNHTIKSWLWDQVKSLFVGLVILLPLMLIFYFLIRISGEMWWFYFSVVLVLFSVLLARIAPVFIFPIFYKFEKLNDGEIKGAVERVAEDAQIDFTGIFSFNLSKETKKANAGFAGLGKGKRIILSDTLIESFTPGEVAIVFAHECGHYRKKHIFKNIVFSTVTTFLMFYACNMVYKNIISALGYPNLHDLPALPVLVLCLSVFGLMLMPINNYISRRHEYEADGYALSITGDKDSFQSAMKKLSDQNLADPDPNPVIETMFYSHPSINKRLEFSERYKI